MVEMLGVLAIIGVLGITGIAGYTTALNKHKANQILNGASVRAVMASTQIQRGVENPTLGEFVDNDLGCGIFDTTVYTKGNLASMPKGQFGIKVSGISKEICQPLLNTIGDKSVLRRVSDASSLTTPLTTCKDTNSFFMIYNDDMSAKAIATDFSDISSCKEAGFIWNNGQCSSDMCETCTAEQTCLTVAEEKKCVSECPSGETRDEETGTCTNNKCTDYTNCEEGYFCNFDRYSTSGTCKAIADITVLHSRKITINTRSYLGIESIHNQLKSYYQAEDWCLAQGGILPTYEYVGEVTAQAYHQCSGSGGSMARELFALISPNVRWIWAMHPSNNREKTFSFRLETAEGNSWCAYENDYKTDRSGICLIPS